TQPALEIATDSSKAVAQVASSVKPTSKDAKPLVEAIKGQTLLPEIVQEQLPADMRTWPLWQLAVSALAAIGVVALFIGLMLRPKHHLPE
ncbi:MAG TPA: hypothetical protein DCQ47_07510, partial [Gammaproteobacteria bacterium]|nr:hypothetical protein [Gammaproteobacteria bacterium]